MSYRVDVRSYRRPDQPQPVYPQVVDTSVRTWMPAINTELACTRTSSRAPLDVRLPDWQPEFTWVVKLLAPTIAKWSPVFSSQLDDYCTPARPAFDVRIPDAPEFTWATKVVEPIIATWSPIFSSQLDDFVTRARAVLDVRNPDTPEFTWPRTVVDRIVASWSPIFSAELDDYVTRAPARADIRDWAAAVAWIFTNLPSGSTVAQQWPALLQALVSSYRVGGRDSSFADTNPGQAWIQSVLDGLAATGNGFSRIMAIIAAQRNSERTLGARPAFEVQPPSVSWLFPILDATVSSWAGIFQGARTQERTADRARLEHRHLVAPDLAWIFSVLPTLTAAQQWPALLQALGLSYRSLGRAGLDVRAQEWAPPFGTSVRLVDSVVSTWPGIWSAQRSDRTPDRAGFDGRLLYGPDLAWIFTNLPSGVTTAQLWPAILLGLHQGVTLARPRLDVRLPDAPAFGWSAFAVDAYFAKLAPVWAAQKHSLRTGERATLDVRGHEWTPEFTWTQRVVDATVGKWIPIFDAEVGLRTPGRALLDVRQITRDPQIGWWSGVLVFVPPQVVSTAAITSATAWFLRAMAARFARSVDEGLVRNLVEGETKPVDITLYDGEGASRTAIDGTGLTVTLILRDRTGALVNVAGEVDWLVATAGTVRYSPAAEDLKAERSPYKARLKLTDSNSDDAFYPNGEADIWTVRK